MTRAKLEPLAARLRVFADGATYGDTYWGASVRWINRTTVDLGLVQKAPTPSQWRATCDLFAAEGCERILFWRWVDGEEVLHEVDLIKWKRKQK